MPLFTLHQPTAKSPSESPRRAGSGVEKLADTTIESAAYCEAVLVGLRNDDRVKIIGELPRMLLIDCDKAVATEWAEKMPDWVLKLEKKAKRPDPRPQLHHRRP